MPRPGGLCERLSGSKIISNTITMAHPRYSSGEIAERGQALYEREIRGSLAATVYAPVSGSSRALHLDRSRRFLHRL